MFRVDLPQVNMDVRKGPTKSTVYAKGTCEL